MGRCYDCGSKGECEDWCGEDIQETYESMCVAQDLYLKYFKRAAELEEENKKLHAILSKYDENYEYYHTELAGSWSEIYREAKAIRSSIKS